jgi:hypothetical protein
VKGCDTDTNNDGDCHLCARLEGGCQRWQLESAEQWLHMYLKRHTIQPSDLTPRLEVLEALWALEIALGRDKHWSSLDA